MKILGYLKECLGSLVLVILLFVLQVQCDLAIPSYTRDMVDIGISQSGIPDAVPERLSQQTFRDVTLLMPDADVTVLADSYRREDSNAPAAVQALLLSFPRSEDKKGQRAHLSEILRTPMALLAIGPIAERLPEDTPAEMRERVEAMAAEFDITKIRAAEAANPAAKDEILKNVDAEFDKLGEFADMQLNTYSTMRVQMEYKALGMDTNKIQKDYLYKTGGMMLLLSLASIICGIIVVLLASRAAAGVARNLRARLFSRVLSFSRAETDKFSPASLVTRSTNDIQHIQLALVMLIRIAIYSPLLGAGAVWNVLQTKTGMSWILGAAVGVLLLMLIAVNFTVIPKFRIMQDLLDRLNLVSREILTGIPVIRAFSREKHEEKRFDTASRSLLKNQLFVNRAMSTLMPLFFFFMNALMVTIVWFSAKGMDTGSIRMGDMMAFITYSMQIVMSFMMLAMIFVFLPRAEVAAGRINEVLATEPTVLDPPEPLDDVSDWKGEIAFSNVSFRFPGAEENVLENISFTAQQGKTTAILGGTGSGKSTLVQLIPRLYDVSSGRVTIDGTDVRDISQRKLRSLIGYVPQKAVLFSGTIDSNLRFGTDELAQEEVVRAARIAQAEDFILEKDEQYGSEISQGGTNVSGGQRQRLAIARAIAKNPKVFVFDDSFSALDFKTDAALRQALHTEISNAALIIVAQRISTVLRADRIIVLDEGRMVGCGTHEELMKSCPAYQEIARSQLSDEELSKGGGQNG
ncbi:MAG: ABC transporter ATP-binding protein/permease [Oscillospiraceae bacterium]|nr:ABC transporter ATP-binding protein/permease [Oscillospiraceae bacterium]